MASNKDFVREDVERFLRMLEDANQPDVEALSPAENRERMKALTKIGELPPRDLAVIRDLVCPGPAGEIPLRLYDTKESRAPSPIVLFLHGGGFVIGDLDVYHSLCTEISHTLDLPVVSVDYRLAPEHTFPAAPEDCEAAARWLADSPDEVGREVSSLIVMGDSAGGNLTIVTANQLSEQPAAVPVIVQAPMYPVADDVSQHESLRKFGKGYFLTAAAMGWFTRQYGGDPTNRRHTPMAEQCTKAPPTVLCTAALDPLRDSGRNYAAHLIQQGTEVAYLEFEGNIHGFATLRKIIPTSQNDLDAFLKAVKLMAEHQNSR